MENYCISFSLTLFDLIQKFKLLKSKTVVVLDAENRVLGLISQGDLIRGLARNLSIYSQLDQIVNKSFIYLNHRNLNEAYRIFKKELINLIPIINNEFKLIDIITQSDVYDYLEG